MKWSADHPTLRLFAFHRVITEEISGKIGDLTIYFDLRKCIVSRPVFVLSRWHLFHRLVLVVIFFILEESIEKQKDALRGEQGGIGHLI